MLAKGRERPSMIGVTASLTVSRARSTMGLSDLPRTIRAKDPPKSRTKVKRWSQAFAEASLRADPPRNLTESLLAGAQRRRQAAAWVMSLPDKSRQLKGFLDFQPLDATPCIPRAHTSVNRCR